MVEFFFKLLPINQLKSSLVSIRRFEGLRKINAEFNATINSVIDVIDD
jgi:hypothetical protein